MCHMFLLNFEFSNACRFRVFQCHFSSNDGPSASSSAAPARAYRSVTPRTQKSADGSVNLCMNMTESRYLRGNTTLVIKHMEIR